MKNKHKTLSMFAILATTFVLILTFVSTGAATHTSTERPSLNATGSADIDFSGERRQFSFDYHGNYTDFGHPLPSEENDAKGSVRIVNATDAPEVVRIKSDLECAVRIPLDYQFSTGNTVREALEFFNIEVEDDLAELWGFGGYVSKDTRGLYDGFFSAFIALDNGQGTDSPDYATPLLLLPPFLNCQFIQSDESMPLFFLTGLVHGNIEISTSN